MLYNSRIHNLSHLLKSLIGNFSSFPFLVPKNQLIVLNYHGTQKIFIQNFIAQIEYLKKRYEIISPEQFNELVNSGKQITGRKLLLTFDDGVKNNLLAVDVLSRLGISALFFVVPQFIDTPAEYQKQFFIKNIRPVINPFVDHEIEDFTSMSWEDLIEVSKKNTIGCHTHSHTMVRNALNQQDLKKELIDSKRMIENRIKLKVNSFCSINNTLVTIGAKERQIIEGNYSYHFTTFGGNNLTVDPYLIRRINVESHWLKGALKFALGPIELNRWEKKLNYYRESTK